MSVLVRKKHAEEEEEEEEIFAYNTRPQGVVARISFTC